MDYELMRLKQAGKHLKECFNITSELIDQAIGEFRQEEAERDKEKQQFYELEKQCKEAGMSEHDTEIVLNAWLEM